MEQKANIKFCFKLGKTFTETFELLKKIYVDDCLFRTRVFEWYKRFQDGREVLEDDPKVGRPKNKNRKELIEKVREMIAYEPYSIHRSTHRSNSKSSVIFPTYCVLQLMLYNYILII